MQVHSLIMRYHDEQVTLSKKVEQAGGATPPRQRRRRVRVTSSDGTPEARKKRTSAVMSTLRL